MRKPYEQVQAYVRRIAESGHSIYDPNEVGSSLWIPAAELEALLDKELKGVSLAGLPLRTRSKFIKQRICEALGYPIPTSFQRTQPRFPGQDFDTYVQKSNNLQVWNEELAPTRRYVLIRVSADDLVTRVRVVTGAALAQLDTTGTLTQKYQARVTMGDLPAELLAKEDTSNLKPILTKRPYPELFAEAPTELPSAKCLLPVDEVYARLCPLIGVSFVAVGYDQERNRGAELHRLICDRLGYRGYRDAGQFPDILNQLVEVKLQTSPTIDLGLVLPSSQEPLDLPKILGRGLRHCDVRYAVFCGETDGRIVALTRLLLTTGERFFERFSQFQGRVLNKKLQIPLPRDFFD